MSQGPYDPATGTAPGAPPPSSGGGGTSVLLIVLGVVLVLGLVCCGGCVMMFYWGAQGVGAAMTEPVMARLRTDPQVTQKLGTNLTSSFPSLNIVNNEATVDFDVTGSLGRGSVHSELVMGPNGWEPTEIRVTADDGTVIDVPTETDPQNLDFGNEFGEDFGGDDAGMDEE
jgi:hypothetical protein